jgi:hypothetical protein
MSLIILLSGSTLYSQNITFYGGVNNNIFHDNIHNNPHHNSSYKSEVGYFAGIGLDSIKVDWMTVYFTLQLDKYGGELKVSDGGLGGGYSTEATIDKWIISLGIYPINFKLFHKIDLNFGFEISRLIHENFNGTAGGWLMGQPGWSYYLEDRYDRYSSKTYFGFKGRIAYDINLPKSIIISPQYSFYYGLSYEFQEHPEDTKSQRHYFCIMIKKKIK